MQRVAVLARPLLEVGIIDPAVLEETVLDVLVDRHDGFDVFQVIQSPAVRHLVEGTQGDEVVDWFHAISLSCQGGTDTRAHTNPKR